LPLNGALYAFGTMMPHIYISGSECLNKVGMSKAIKLHLCLGLKEAKTYTDKLLTDGELSIDIPDNCNIHEFLASLQQARANAKIVE
jgi:ribosomal protein L7/L12